MRREDVWSEIKFLRREQMKIKNCSVCGSDKIIPDAPVMTHTNYGGSGLMVTVDRHPEALFIKERYEERLRAWICGECGHTHLFVKKPKRIYDVYKASQGEEGV